MVNISLQERKTGQSGEAERLQLQHTARALTQAETEHEHRYGGTPRTVLLPAERDYLRQHKDAVVAAQPRAELDRELAQAFVIGETRAGASFERTADRAPERPPERPLERERSGFGFSR